LAKLCYELLLEYGLDAKIACEAHAVTPALEKIVEAIPCFPAWGLKAAVWPQLMQCMMPDGLGRNS